MNDPTDKLSRSNDTNAASGSKGPSPALIGFGIVAVLAIIFFLQNGEQQSIDFWVFEWETTIRWAILMSIAFGVVLDRLFSFWWRRRGKRKQKQND
jgi:uncharacterized integral membrane protein